MAELIDYQRAGKDVCRNCITLEASVIWKLLDNFFQCGAKAVKRF